MVLEKTLESPLDCKEIQPVHSEGDQPWDFFGGNGAKNNQIPILKKKKNFNLYLYPEGDQPWDFFGRNNAKAEAPVLWPPHVES